MRFLSSVSFICLLAFLCTLLLTSFHLAPGNNSLKNQVANYPLVRQAKTTSDDLWKQRFAEHNLDYNNFELYFRVLKYEHLIEVWVKSGSQKTYKKLEELPICSMSGHLGPKRQQGDYQVPEGLYRLSYFNPSSKYHLSMKINYPNDSDKMLTYNKAKPGNHIMIHGNCVSAGCMAIQNAPIENLYWLALKSHSLGKKNTPVHVFPCNMNSFRYKLIKHYHQYAPKELQFWEDLKVAYDAFDANKQVPSFSISKEGRYLID